MKLKNISNKEILGMAKKWLSGISNEDLIKKIKEEHTSTLRAVTKQLMEFDNKMSYLADDIWDFKFCYNIGNRIKELDKFKWSYFGEENLKRNRVTCVFDLPNYGKIKDEVFRKFIPIYKEIKSFIKKRDTDYIYACNSGEMTKLMTYIFYHYGGWIERYCTKKHRQG